jgi:RNA polymerase sigma-70 factor (ECF subfamily)
MYTDFTEELRQELPALRRMARWFSGDPHRAEDLLQDTLVLALRFKDNFREGTNLRAWLMRVMRNRHISLMRRKQLERRIMETEGRYSLTDWSIGAAGRRSMQRDGDVYRDHGLSDPVVSAMDELRPEFREVVWLCDVEGLSYADAASQISCPVGTIMSRLHRGRRALRRRLGSRQQVEAAA